MLIPPSHRKIAYLTSWFPAVSETFILEEILELERQGLRVEVFPLLGAYSKPLHPGSEAVMRRAHYCRLLSVALVLAQLYWLFASPRVYLRTWRRCLKGNAPSFPFLLRAFIVVPKAALLAREMQSMGITHVHAHWATYPTLAAFVIRELTGISYSFTAHAHDLYVDRTMLGEKLASASFVVTISELNRRLLVDTYGLEAARKTVVIRCGIDPAKFQPPPSRAASPKFTFLCVAALRDYKGHPVLLDACRRLKSLGLSFRLQLVGEGEDRLRLEALAKSYGLTNEVVFLGAQPSNMVRALMRSVDAFVLPSIVTSYGKMEGLPVALIEAMACGLPSIATAVSAIPELVTNEESGLLVPPGNAAALADAMVALMSSADLRERLATNARARVLEQFVLSSNVAMLRELLMQGLDGVKRRANSPPEVEPPPSLSQGAS